MYSLFCMGLKKKTLKKKDFFSRKFFLFIWMCSVSRSRESESEVSKVNPQFKKKSKFFVEKEPDFVVIKVDWV